MSTSETSEEKKKMKATWFSSLEVEKLLDVLEEEELVFGPGSLNRSFNKLTKDANGTVRLAGTAKDKKEQWEEIAKRLEPFGKMKRSGQQVKRKKEKIFSEVKKKAAAVAKTQSKTGLGKDWWADSVDLNETEKRVMNLLGRCAVEGSRNDLNTIKNVEKILGIPGGVTSSGGTVNNNNNNNNSNMSASSVSQIMQQLTRQDIQERLDMNYTYLNDVLQGRVPCRRLVEFEAGGRSSESLRWQLPLSRLSDDQCDWATECLLEAFCTDPSERLKYFDKVMKVILPEFLIRIAMDVMRLSHEEAEKYLSNDVPDVLSTKDVTPKEPSPPPNLSVPPVPVHTLKEVTNKLETTTKQKFKKTTKKRSFQQTQSDDDAVNMADTPCYEKLVYGEMKRTNDLLESLINVQQKKLDIQAKQLKMSNLQHSIFLMEKNIAEVKDVDSAAIFSSV